MYICGTGVNSLETLLSSHLAQTGFQVARCNTTLNFDKRRQIKAKNNVTKLKTPRYNIRVKVYV